MLSGNASLFLFQADIEINFSITANDFCFLCNHISLIYLHEIFTIVNILRKARGPDRNPSRAGSGPPPRLWGPLL